MRQCRYVAQPIKNKKIKGAESESVFVVEFSLFYVEYDFL